MRNFLLVVLLIFNVNLYSYSLGVGFLGGGAATDIKDLESTAKCSDCVNDFEYKHKLGVAIINKFQISETIYFKLNLSLINFKIDFKKEDIGSPFLVKTDVALEFYPIKELLEGFYFGGGLFINYFLAEGFSEPNHGFSMLSAFLNLGYKIPLSENLSFFGDFSAEMFDIISLETKTKAYIGLTGTLYLLYDF